MCRLYAFARFLVQRWLIFAILLIIVTFVLGMIGFAQQDSQRAPQTNAYLTILLFTLNNEKVGGNVGWELEAARWLGAVVWFFTILSILIQLFRQPVLVLFIAAFTLFRRGHVIVAGLGDPQAERDRLVERLREQGRDVVVIEEDAEHPGLETCRQAGAVCLTGSPLEPAMLQQAQLTRARTLLSLREDDRKNIKLLSLAASIIGSGENIPRTEDDDPLAPTNPDSVGCVIQVSEPRLLEVLGQHDWNRDPYDRMHLRLFNTHEIVARAMLRECLIGMEMPALRKILLLGIGAGGRMGEALVLRAVKDCWIDAEPGSSAKIEIHVLDENADEWVQCIRQGMSDKMTEVCRLVPVQRPANRCGFRAHDSREELKQADFDAVFVCMGPESQALIQTAALREILLERTPIIVRVHDEATGFGSLLSKPNAGGLGKNIRVVGVHDRVFDLVASMNPMVEMVAQVMHQDYLALTQRKLLDARARGDLEKASEIERKKAFVPWSQLSENYRESNRALARRLREHLNVPPIDRHPGRQFSLKFWPRDLISPGDSYQLSDEEITALAMQEHALWMETMLALGWRPGHGDDPDSSDDARKLSPHLVPWDKLVEHMKDYDCNIIRRLPFVFAKADQKVVPIGLVRARG